MTWRFRGTDAEWRELHRARCREVKLKIPIHRPGGRDTIDAINMLCLPESPCDGCKEWARKQLEED
jgi:hypothetical protein